jgi:phosphoribosylglycinamide formyltransferase-1
MSKELNIAFYVSRKATRFFNILEKSNPSVRESVKIVFSDDQTNLYLKDYLNSLNITYELFDYKKLPRNGNDRNLTLSNRLCEILDAHSIDYCFSFGSHILKGDLLTKYKNRIINFHPAILPGFPGRKAIDQAVEANVTLLGNTAHFIDEGVDTGPIILQSVQHMNVFNNYGYDGILDVQIEMFNQIYDLLLHDRIHVINNKVVIDGVDYNHVSFFPNVR